MKSPLTRRNLLRAAACWLRAGKSVHARNRARPAARRLPQLLFHLGTSAAAVARREPW